MSPFWILILAIGVFLTLLSAFTLARSRKLGQVFRWYQEETGKSAGGLFGILFGGVVFLGTGIFLIYAALTEYEGMQRDEAAFRKLGTSAIGTAFGWSAVAMGLIVLAVGVFMVWRWSRKPWTTQEADMRKVLTAFTGAIVAFLGLLTVALASVVLAY